MHIGKSCYLLDNLTFPSDYLDKNDGASKMDKEQERSNDINALLQRWGDGL